MKRILVSLLVILSFGCKVKSTATTTQKNQLINKENMKKVVFVLTSHDELGNTGEKTELRLV